MSDKTAGDALSKDGKAPDTIPLSRLFALVAGPLIAVVLLCLPPPAALSEPAWHLVAIVLWMVIWWLSEAIALPVTALLPIPLFPLLGISSVSQTTSNYAHELIYLFLGGFMLAAAMQRSNLHRRIALKVISLVGTRPTSIVAGFMLATAMLSMWISNTATTIMMLSVAASVIALHDEQAENCAQSRNFSIALLLGIAYSASIGGLGTLIGTPPNALLASVLKTSHGIEISFLTWMLFAIPVVLFLLPVTWYLLVKVLYPSAGSTDLGGGTLTLEFDQLGPMRRDEKLVLVLFVLAASGWIFGKEISNLTGLVINDTSVAITIGILAFSVPYSLRRPRFLLEWSDTRELPWGLLLIFGGGLAIASAFGTTGLATAIGGSITGFGAFGIWPFVLLVSATMVFLTEITSNTASAATFLPIVGAIAVGLGYDPRLLMVPVTLAASMAFMMPVATPPNAIVFSHPDLHIRDMVYAGTWLNFIAIGACFAAVYFLSGPVFGIATP
ncbi:MAG: DASS family sodium-coupled anion symporter [Hyphomicrobiaceae bacterium]|nr:DASS family sodium-coupled anion symporter [Hyphomicrobiaceae bacterium]